MSRQPLLTYRDYVALPDDGKRHELHDGVLSVTPAPSPQHQIVTRNLFRALDAHGRRRNLGEVLFAPLDVILSDTNVLQPDLIWLDPSRLTAITRRGIEGPPTLVVETLSPSTLRADRVTKPRLYTRYGVPWLWLVDPEAHAIEVYRSGDRVMIARGGKAMDVPPFDELGLLVDSLWP